MTWALIGACCAVVAGIATCLVLIFVHLATLSQRSDNLIRIDLHDERVTCQMEQQDRQTDQAIIIAAHLRIHVPPPLRC